MVLIHKRRSVPKNHFQTGGVRSD